MDILRSNSLREIVNSAINLYPCPFNRFTLVDALPYSKDFAMPLDQLRYTVQILRSLRSQCLRPSLESLLRRFHGSLDILRAAIGKPRKDLSGLGVVYVDPSVCFTCCEFVGYIILQQQGLVFEGWYYGFC